jgi:hypothetical protein
LCRISSSRPWKSRKSGHPKGWPRGRKRKLTDKFVAALMNDFDLTADNHHSTARQTCLVVKLEWLQLPTLWLTSQRSQQQRWSRADACFSIHAHQPLLPRSGAYRE